MEKTLEENVNAASSKVNIISKEDMRRLAALFSTASFYEIMTILNLKKKKSDQGCESDARRISEKFRNNFG